MNDKRSDDWCQERLAELAGDYNEPPAVPRDAMWEQIAARRAVVALPWWRSRRVLWPAAAAAVLVLGIGIGRLSVSVNDRGQLATTDSAANRGGTAPATVADAGQPGFSGQDILSPGIQEAGGRTGGGLTGDEPSPQTHLYRYAAAPFLGQAEMLLAQYRTGETASSNGESFTTRAARLLSQTRLLLDSPAAEDTELQQLLSDLELVLARMVRYAGGADQEEKEWIDRKLQQRFLLPRLRAQIPTGAGLTTM